MREDGTEGQGLALAPQKRGVPTTTKYSLPQSHILPKHNANLRLSKVHSDVLTNPRQNGTATYQQPGLVPYHLKVTSYQLNRIQAIWLRRLDTRKWREVRERKSSSEKAAVLTPGMLSPINLKTTPADTCLVEQMGPTPSPRHQTHT